MRRMALKLKARAADSERKTAAAAGVAAEAAAAAAALAEPSELLAPPKSGDSERTPKTAAREARPEKFLTDKERRKIEKQLREQRRREERKKEKERKKVQKMLRKKGPREEARGPEAAAGTAAGEGTAEGADGHDEGAAAGGTSRAWAEWDTDSGDEDDAYYAAPRVGGIVWRPGPLKAGALGAHLPLVVLLVFSVRGPCWALSLLLPQRTEQGRGCGFVFGATCCLRAFLGCAFFSYWSGRARRRGHGRSGAGGAFGSGSGSGSGPGPGQGGRRRGREERLI